MREALAWGLVVLGLAAMAAGGPGWVAGAWRRWVRRAGAAVGLLGVVLVYGLHSHSGPAAGGSSPGAEATRVQQGEAVYAAHCADCHGTSARGGGPRAALLQPAPSDLITHVPQHTDAELFGWVAGGFPRSAMPAFRETLNVEQTWAVVAHLRSLALVRSSSRLTGGERR